MVKEKIKLTPKQNAVIWCLQNGWMIITDSDMKGAIIGCSTHQFHIDNGVFWRLVDKGLIYQGGALEHHHFILSKKGEEIKTKPVTL